MSKKVKSAEEKAAAVTEINEKIRDNEIRALKTLITNSDQKWRKTWSDDGIAQKNATTDKAYRNSNQIILTAAMLHDGYKDPRWITTKQAAQKGYAVQEGAPYEMISFATHVVEVNKKDKNGKLILDEEGKPEKKVIPLKKPILRYFFVTNGANVDGIPEFKLPNYTPEELNEKQVISYAKADEIIKEWTKELGVTLKEVPSKKAFFAPERTFKGFNMEFTKGGEIVLPMREQFENLASFYAVAFHELAHSTLAEEGMRTVDETNENLIFGGKSYAKEELVAELTSLFMCQELGIDTSESELNQQSWAYIRSWTLSGMLNDNDLHIALKDAKKVTSTLLKYAPEMTFEKALELDKQKALDNKIDVAVDEILDDKDSDPRSDLAKLWNVTNDIEFIAINSQLTPLENVQQNQSHLKEIRANDTMTLSQVADKSLYLLSVKKGENTYYLAHQDQSLLNDYFDNPEKLFSPESSHITTDKGLPFLAESLRQISNDLSTGKLVDHQLLTNTLKALNTLNYFSTETEITDPHLMKVIDDLSYAKEDINSLIAKQVIVSSIDDQIKQNEEILDVASSLYVLADAITDLGIEDKALSVKEYVAKYEKLGLPDALIEKQESEFENDKGLSVTTYIAMPDRLNAIGKKTGYKVTSEQGDVTWLDTPKDVHQLIKNQVKPTQQTYAEIVFNDTLRQGTFNPSHNRIVHGVENARSVKYPENRLYLSDDAINKAIAKTVIRLSDHTLPVNIEKVDVQYLFSQYDYAALLPDLSVLARKDEQYATFQLNKNVLNDVFTQINSPRLNAVKQSENYFGLFQEISIRSVAGSSYEFADKNYNREKEEAQQAADEVNKIRQNIKDALSSFKDMDVDNFKELPVGNIHEIYSESEIQSAISDDLTMAELALKGEELEWTPVNFVHYSPSDPAIMFEDKSILLPNKEVIYDLPLADFEIKHSTIVNNTTHKIIELEKKYEAVEALLKDNPSDMHITHLNDLSEQLYDVAANLDPIFVKLNNLRLSTIKSENSSRFTEDLRQIVTEAENNLNERPTLAEQAVQSTDGLLTSVKGSLIPLLRLDLLEINASEDRDFNVLYGVKDKVNDISSSMRDRDEYGKLYAFGDDSALLLKFEDGKHSYALLPKGTLRSNIVENAIHDGRTFLFADLLEYGPLRGKTLQYEDVSIQNSLSKGYLAEEDIPAHQLVEQLKQTESIKEEVSTEQVVNNSVEHNQNFKGVYAKNAAGEIFAIGKTVEQVKELVSERFDVPLDQLPEFAKEHQLSMSTLHHLDLDKVYQQEHFLTNMPLSVMKDVVNADKGIDEMLKQPTCAEIITYMTKNGTYNPIRQFEGNYHPYGRDLQQILNIYGRTNKEMPRDSTRNANQEIFDGQYYQFQDFSVLEYKPNDGLSAHRNDEDHKQHLTQQVQERVLNMLRGEYVKMIKANQANNNPNNEPNNGPANKGSKPR